LASALEVTRGTGSLDASRKQQTWWFKQQKHGRLDGFATNHGGLTNNNNSSSNNNNSIIIIINNNNNQGCSNSSQLNHGHKREHPCDSDCFCSCI
jgi:hypothetical protein